MFLDAAQDLADRCGSLVRLPEDLLAVATCLAAVDRALVSELRAALADDLPLKRQDGGFVRHGYDSEIDESRLLGQDSRKVIAALQARFPALTAPSSESICYATTNRQEAVKKAAPGTEVFLIVGAPNSSNSMRLVEVAKRHGARDSMLVQRAADIDWRRIGDAATIGMSAGASAPEIVVEEIIDALRERRNVTVDIALTAEENELFPVMRSLRDTPLTGQDMAFLNGSSS